MILAATWNIVFKLWMIKKLRKSKSSDGGKLLKNHSGFSQRKVFNL